MLLPPTGGTRSFWVMFGETEKMGEIQRVERSSQEEIDEVVTVMKNQHMKIGTMIFGRKENFSVGRNEIHKQCKLNRVKNLIQNERWVGCRPSIENGCSS
jgi:hypothetical protein